MATEEELEERSKRRRKILWCLVFVFSFIGFSHQSGTFLSEYFTRPVVTSSYVRIGQPVRFPSITVCNQNKFQFDKFKNVCQTYLDDEFCKKIVGVEYIVYSDPPIMMDVAVPAPRNFRFCKEKKEEAIKSKNSISNVEDFNNQTLAHNISMTEFNVNSSYINFNDSKPAPTVYFSSEPLEYGRRKVKRYVNDSMKPSEYLSAEAMWILEKEMSKEELVSISHDFGSMIKKCMFMGRLCSERNFTRTYNYHYGNCWTFKPRFHNGQPATVLKSGSRFGLTLDLYDKLNKLNILEKYKGFKLLVHDEDEVPFMFENGVDINTNKKTTIKVTKSEKNWLKEPYYTNCEERDVSEFLQNGYHFKYLATVCNNHCLQKLVFESCNCIDPELYFDGSIYNSSVCDVKNQTQVCCLENLMDTMQEGVRCGCNVPCRQIDYQTQMMEIHWFPEEEDYTESLYSSQLARISVFYETTDVRVDEIKPKYKVVDIFSNIGGQIGLWLGVSLVALYEVGEQAFIKFHQLVKERFKKKRRQVISGKY